MNVFGFILDILLTELLGGLFWIILQVVGRILATPIILSLAMFGPDRYWDKVGQHYRNWFRWTWRSKLG